MREKGLRRNSGTAAGRKLQSATGRSFVKEIADDFNYKNQGSVSGAIAAAKRRLGNGSLAREYRRVESYWKEYPYRITSLIPFLFTGGSTALGSDVVATAQIAAPVRFAETIAD